MKRNDNHKIKQQLTPDMLDLVTGGTITNMTENSQAYLDSVLTPLKRTCSSKADLTVKALQEYDRLNMSQKGFTKDEMVEYIELYYDFL